MNQRNQGRIQIRTCNGWQVDYWFGCLGGDVDAMVGDPEMPVAWGPPKDGSPFGQGDPNG